MYLRTHVTLCPYSGVLSQVVSRLRDTDLENVFVSGHTLPSLILHMPTGLHTSTGLLTLSTYLPLFSLELYLPHRNPLVTCYPSLNMYSHTHDKWYVQPINTLLHTAPRPHAPTSYSDE